MIPGICAINGQMKSATLLKVFSVFSGAQFISFFDVVDRSEEFLSRLAPSATAVLPRVQGRILDFDDRGYQPLHYAIQEHAPLELITSFIDTFDADINEPTVNEGLTPLMLAIKLNNVPIVTKLITYRMININYAAKDGRTALHYACQVGNPEVVEMLLDRGARNFVKMSGNVMRPLHLAISHRHLAVVKIFRRRNMHIVGSYYRDHVVRFESPLHLLSRMTEAAFSAADRIEMLSLLVPENESNDVCKFNRICEANSQCQTALHVAAELGNDAIVAGLLVFRADWNVRDMQQQVPKHPLIDTLRLKYSNRSCLITLDASLWLFAVEMNSLEMVIALRHAGLDTSSILTEGALNKAMEFGYDVLASEFVKLLNGQLGPEEVLQLMQLCVLARLPATLAAFIQIFRPESLFLSNQFSLLHLAAATPAFSVLSPADSRSQETLDAISIEIARYLAYLNPSLLNSADLAGNTPLHIAVSCGFSSFFRSLLEFNFPEGTFNIDCVDGNGQTPLFLALQTGQSELAMLLLQLGAREELAIDPQSQQKLNLESLSNLFVEQAYDSDDEPCKKPEIVKAAESPEAVDWKEDVESIEASQTEPTIEAPVPIVNQYLDHIIQTASPYLNYLPPSVQSYLIASKTVTEK